VVAGAAQGLVVLLAFATLLGIPMGAGFLAAALLVAAAMLLVALGASFLHLGRPERAWRAVAMWRTSWLSREVIVLPAFIGSIAAWWLALRVGQASPLWPLLAILLAALLWYCTAMIYACIRFIQEWAHPLTLVNYTLIGLASGVVLACALAALGAQDALLRVAGPAALVLTVAAGLTRGLALRRNATLKLASTLQSATGIRSPHLRQKSMGFTGGAFNTREFFHGRSAAVLANIRLIFVLLAFVGPALLVAAALAGAPPAVWLLAAIVQAPGLVAERWFFFAQARHPQNLYYQVVS